MLLFLLLFPLAIVEPWINLIGYNIALLKFMYIATTVSEGKFATKLKQGSSNQPTVRSAVTVEENGLPIQWTMKS